MGGSASALRRPGCAATRPPGFYLALAEAKDVPLVTSERRLLAVVRGTAWAEHGLALGGLTVRPPRGR
jgi:hypothetical protein